MKTSRNLFLGVVGVVSTIAATALMADVTASEAAMHAPTVVKTDSLSLLKAQAAVSSDATLRRPL